MEGKRSFLSVDVAGAGAMLGAASRAVGLQVQWLAVGLDAGRSLVAAGVPPAFCPSLSSVSVLRWVNLCQEGNLGDVVPCNSEQNPRSMRQKGPMSNTFFVHTLNVRWKERKEL